MHLFIYVIMEKKLRRTTGSEKMLFGICGGMAKFFSLDVMLIRILWAVATVFGVGSPIIIYIVMGFIVPKEGQ
ncbi:Phage shock protein PspC (stress-responsive transcriptional regulator) [Spirosomataceae bacterium TFI 002]|nr:Phage shock protein PspC (stress-responsive transcriptional regulator) [Spirosomataceae bacterium TFI 002]